MITTLATIDDQVEILSNLYELTLDINFAVFYAFKVSQRL